MQTQDEAMAQKWSNRRKVFLWTAGIIVGLIVLVAVIPTPSQQGSETASTSPQQASTPRQPTATREATATRVPPTPTAAPVGMDRLSPMPLGQSTTAGDGIELTVVSLERDASRKIIGFNQFNDAVESGEEAVLVMVKTTCKKAASETCKPITSHFRIVGEKAVIYTAEYHVLRPEIDQETFGGGSAQGYTAFHVGAGEQNLVLMYTATSRGTVYLATQ